MKFIVLLFHISISFNIFASDMSQKYEDLYSKEFIFNIVELNQLENIDFIFVPGILAEATSWSDTRSILNFSKISKNYFMESVQGLRNKYGASTYRISTDIHEYENAMIALYDQTQTSILNNRNIIYITHDLGGPLVLDLLVRFPLFKKAILGNIFIQAPFYGTPIADAYLKNPYYVESLLTPLNPLVDTSRGTINHLSSNTRIEFMAEHKVEIESILNDIPSITLGSSANGYLSIFKPTLDILEFGCVKSGPEDCMTRKVFKGETTLSDGMVPIMSTRLPNTPFILLEGVDHGETVVKLPFQNIDQLKMVESLIKLILLK